VSKGVRIKKGKLKAEEKVFNSYSSWLSKSREEI
jgi:hypothetical protein